MTTWIANAERCQRMDQRASQEFGIPGDQLMERAGKLVFEAMVELLPDGGSLTVLCGKGNNGGDGFVVARLAHERGYGVECLVATQNPGDLSPLCALQFEKAVAAGITPHFASETGWTRRLESIPCRDLVIDALLGTGVTGPVHGPILEAIEAVNRSGTPVVSVDIPSGVHTDTGEELGASIWALRTVTIGLPKPCLFQGIGIEHSGFWTVADIGYPAEVLREPTEAFLVNEQWVGQFLPERFRASHKGSNGHTLIVAGSHWMPGSAVLAAKAAVRAGAGLVTVASVPSVCQAVMAQVPEAILLPLPEVDGVIAPAAAEVIRNYPRRFQSALFGPGITHQAPVREFLQRVWENWEHPACIDADALNLVAECIPLPAGPTVITPHPGEMSRLMQESIAQVQNDRFDTITRASEQYQTTVLLKGPYSLIRSPREPIIVNSTGNPGMASAGMGDVLAGVIATLLAQELPPAHAAAVGAYWHGAAGDWAAENIGPVGFLAHEVADALPRARVTMMGTCGLDSFSCLGGSEF